MGWQDDRYARETLDSRERWGATLSVTAIAALLLFLAEHEHEAWLSFSPFVTGVIAFIYLVVVSSYYEEAERLADATDSRPKVNWLSWAQYTWDIGFLGWLIAVIPLMVGIFATCALLFGLVPPQVAKCG